MLARDHRPARSVEIVEDAQKLVLDEAALLLDHEDVAQVLKAPRALRLQRPRQPNLVEPQVEARRSRLVDPEVVQSLTKVAIGFPSPSCPRRGTELSSVTRSKRFARAKAPTASIFGPRRRSCSSGASGQRMDRRPGSASKVVRDRDRGRRGAQRAGTLDSF